MKIETSRFGTVEINEEQIFTFPMGLLGFAKYKEFVVIDHTEESPFSGYGVGGSWLSSSQTPYFVADSDRVRRSSYRCWMFRVKRIWSSGDKAHSQNPQDMTANLLAPLIFNMRNRKGMQHVLTNSNYSVKYSVLKNRKPINTSSSNDGRRTKAISLS